MKIKISKKADAVCTLAVLALIVVGAPLGLIFGWSSMSLWVSLPLAVIVGAFDFLVALIVVTLVLIEVEDRYYSRRYTPKQQNPEDPKSGLTGPEPEQRILMSESTRRSFEIHVRSSYSPETGTGLWSARIWEPENQRFSQISITGEIHGSDPDEPEITAAIQSIQKIPQRTHIRFRTACPFFHEGASQQIRENPESVLWKEFDRARKRYTITWSLVLDATLVQKKPAENLEVRSGPAGAEEADSPSLLPEPSGKDPSPMQRHATSGSRNTATARKLRISPVSTASARQPSSGSSGKQDAYQPERHKTPPKFQLEQKSLWVQQYKDGKTTKQIAEEAQADPNTVRTALKDHQAFKARLKNPEEKVALGEKAYQMRVNKSLTWKDINQRLKTGQDASTLRVYAKIHAETHSLPWPVSVRRGFPLELCGVPVCQENAVCKGLCAFHYKRMIHGRPMIAPYRKITQKAQSRSTHKEEK